MKLRHSRTVTAVALSPDGRTAATACVGNHPVRVWDLETLKSSMLIESITKTVRFSADGNKLLVVSLFDPPREWDWRKRELVGEPWAPFAAWDVSLVGRVALKSTNNENACAFDPLTGETIAELQPPMPFIYAQALSWDGRLAILGCSARTVCVWDVRTGHKIQSFKHEVGVVVVVAIASDGRTAVTTHFNHVFVWDVRSANVVQTLEGHADRIVCASLSKDGNKLITGSCDCTARVWDFTPKWKLEVWALLTTLKWGREMAWELSHFF